MNNRVLCIFLTVYGVLLWIAGLIAAMRAKKVAVVEEASEERRRHIHECFETMRRKLKR